MLLAVLLWQCQSISLIRQIEFIPMVLLPIYLYMQSGKVYTSNTCSSCWCYPMPARSIPFLSVRDGKSFYSCNGYWWCLSGYQWDNSRKQSSRNRLADPIKRKFCPAIAGIKTKCTKSPWSMWTVALIGENCSKGTLNFIDAVITHRSARLQ